MKKSIIVMTAMLAIVVVGCKRKDRLITEGPSVPPSFALAPENVSGTWTGSYTITYHTGQMVTLPLTVVMEQPPRGNGIDGTWNNGTDILRLIGAHAGGAGAYIQAIGSNVPGSNPYRHYSYSIECRFTDSTFKTMALEIRGNDFNGGIVGFGTGSITRP